MTSLVILIAVVTTNKHKTARFIDIYLIHETNTKAFAIKRLTLTF